MAESRPGAEARPSLQSLFGGAVRPTLVEQPTPAPPAPVVDGPAPEAASSSAPQDDGDRPRHAAPEGEAGERPGLITPHALAPTPPASKNEFGEIDGELGSNGAPQLFLNFDKIGTGVVHGAGGNGGQGVENAGQILVIAPVYGSDVHMGQGRAWVQPGTGIAIVTRSFRGVLVGANTLQYYFTPAAAARVDVHERAHVIATQLLHNQHIQPLEQRIAQHVGQPNALVHGTTAPAALAQLQAFINWNNTVTTFQALDILTNMPMGPVDIIDMALPGFPQNWGPMWVHGVRFNNYMAVPGDQIPWPFAQLPPPPGNGPGGPGGPGQGGQGPRDPRKRRRDGDGDGGQGGDKYRRELTA